MQRDDFLRWGRERMAGVEWQGIRVLAEEGELEGRGKRGRGG